MYFFPPPCARRWWKIQHDKYDFYYCTGIFFNPSEGKFAKTTQLEVKSGRDADCAGWQWVVRVGAQKGQFHPFNNNNRGKLSESAAEREHQILIYDIILHWGFKYTHEGPLHSRYSTYKRIIWKQGACAPKLFLYIRGVHGFSTRLSRCKPHLTHQRCRHNKVIQERRGKAVITVAITPLSNNWWMTDLITDKSAISTTKN